MSDEAIRTADREAAIGGLAEEAHALAERTRDGLPWWRVQLAAYCRHPAARAVMGWDQWGEEGREAVAMDLVLDGFQMHCGSSQGWIRQGPEGWFRGLLRWGLVPPMLGMAAAARARIQHVQHVAVGVRGYVHPGGVGCMPDACICSEDHRRFHHGPVLEVVRLVQEWVDGVHGVHHFAADKILAAFVQEDGREGWSVAGAQAREAILDAVRLAYDAGVLTRYAAGPSVDREFGARVVALHDRCVRRFDHPERFEMDLHGLVPCGFARDVQEVLQAPTDAHLTAARTSTTTLAADMAEMYWLACRTAWKAVVAVARMGRVVEGEVQDDVARAVAAWALAEHAP